MSDGNFCVRCRWFKRRWATPLADYGKCLSPKNFELDPVTGKQKPINYFVDNARIFGCRGDWFQRRVTLRDLFSPPPAENQQ